MEIFMKITELKPEKVFFYFSEIAKIPRGSGNTEKIAEYCISFAKKRGLESFQDSYGNVILFKEGTAGYEQSEPVIIQGHLDMVCEKLPDCPRDMEHEGIDIVTDGEYIWADGTTLGGDDGIAVAYILALLDFDDVPHPPIEALLTTDEEIGLRGAGQLDTSKIKGRRLINIDSESEGIFTVSCAGGVRTECRIPVSFTKNDNDKKDNICAERIKIGGLIGGHSGIDINKRRRNAVKVLAELLYEISSRINIYIADFFSGGRLNVIPQTAEAVICFKGSESEKLDIILNEFNDTLKKDCATVEPEAYAAAENTEKPRQYADRESTERLIFTLMQIFDGVYAMSPDISELVLASSNIGSVHVEDGFMKIGLMIRSNTASGKQAVLRRLKSLVEYIGGTVNSDGDYPAWEYRQHSPLRDTMVEVYREMYGKAPRICAIHAGLECGILSEKLGDTDMVSIGPDMENVHTPGERLSVKSAERCWQYLLRLLEALK